MWDSRERNLRCSRLCQHPAQIRTPPGWLHCRKMFPVQFFLSFSPMFCLFLLMYSLVSRLFWIGVSSSKRVGTYILPRKTKNCVPAAGDTKSNDKFRAICKKDLPKDAQARMNPQGSPLSKIQAHWICTGMHIDIRPAMNFISRVKEVREVKAQT